MTGSHAESLRHLLPPSRAKIVQRLDPTGRDIPDPIGGSADTYRRCAVRIEAALCERLDVWA
jgi:protein-tyrosine-phosphatase